MTEPESESLFCLLWCDCLRSTHTCHALPLRNFPTDGPQNIYLLRGLQAVTVVVFITLALFFASGMYEEKIRYAHA